MDTDNITNKNTCIMKQIFTILVALLATTNLWAYDFRYGELYYNITSYEEPYTVEVTYQSTTSSNYSDFTSVTIPETVTYEGTTYSVTSIGIQAFVWCNALTSVTIPNSVTSIGKYAFAWCSLLTSVTIPNSVTSIGEGAFQGCSSLTSVTIPNSVTSIGEEAFGGCDALTSITIPNSVTSIGELAFQGCSSLTSITISNSVMSIGYAAFNGCSALTSITIPNSVTSIGNWAFGGCSSLTSITIPNSVTSIGASAFSGCSALTSVTIGNSVTSIGNYAFCYCESLKTVICEAIEVPELGNSVFYDMPVSEATLYVPAQSLDDYKAAEQWKEFWTILPIEETSTSVENTYNTSSTAVTNKLIRDGQVIIVRGGKSYSVMGQEL